MYWNYFVCLIAMSAYSSFEDVVIDLAEQNHMPCFIGNMEKPFVKLALKMLFGNEKVNELKPIKQIKNAKEHPVLLVACTEDTGVPAVSTERLRRANPKVQTWIRDSWEHFIVKNCDFKNMRKDTEYCETVLKFLSQLELSSKV